MKIVLQQPPEAVVQGAPSRKTPSLRHFFLPFGSQQQEALTWRSLSRICEQRQSKWARCLACARSTGTSVSLWPEQPPWPLCSLGTAECWQSLGVWALPGCCRASGTIQSWARWISGQSKAAPQLDPWALPGMATPGAQPCHAVNQGIDSWKTQPKVGLGD